MDAVMVATDRTYTSGENIFIPELSDTRSLRKALGAFTTGVTVVTAIGNHGPIGMTVNSFASVSLDPPLVLWSPAKSSSRYDCFINAEHFAIHVLDAVQDGLSADFTHGGHGFENVEWHVNQEGIPAIRGTLARFECARAALHDAGDHSIIIGRILRVAHREGDPLCFSRGTFGRFARIS
jgi:flavin reductase (DIM6/NTAB) family NADH-FMN oxidoreductase RutF